MYGVNHETLPFRVIDKALTGVLEVKAAFKDPEDAAMSVSNGTGRFVYYASLPLPVWTEGQEEIHAGESVDQAAATMWERIDRAYKVPSNRAERRFTGGRAET